MPVDGLAVWTKEKTTEPPAYMRELSCLVTETASEEDFGEIKLTIGESEIEVDSDGEVNLKDVVLLRRYLASGWYIELNQAGF